MGTTMAPAYANLFMGQFEDLYMVSEHPYRSKIVLYKRYIDDLFLIWGGGGWKKEL